MVDHVRTVWQVSIRRACQALPVDRSTYHYRSKRTGQAVLMKRIKEIAKTPVRYGYRRIHVLLGREGWLVNVKRVYRLYRAIGRWDCNYATNRPSGVSRRSCGRTVRRRPQPIRFGRWILSTISSLTGARSAF